MKFPGKHIIVVSLFLMQLLVVNAQEVKFQIPTIILADVSSTIQVLSDQKELKNISVTINNEVVDVQLINGEGEFKYLFTEEQDVFLKTSEVSYTQHVNPIPGWLSIIPPLIAIMMALVFREVISSLFTGIFVGASIIHGYSDGFFFGLINGFKSVVDTYLIDSLYERGHLSVVIFSILIGGMVFVISKNGGMLGVVNIISKYAKNARSGQLVTWFLGVAIFFDDYTNTLVVGNTMRPITDKLRISREKLSYIVDSTAAPVAAIAFVTTWIGAELGYIEDGIGNLPEIKEGAYSIFMNSLSFSFYPIFTLAFMLILIWKQKDFGPMYKAEMRARTTGEVSRKIQKIENEIIDEDELDELEPLEGVIPRWYNAVIPVGFLILGTIIGLFQTGFEGIEATSDNNFFENITWLFSNNEYSMSETLRLVIGSADSYKALLWSSMLGLLSAIILTVSQRIMGLSAVIESTIIGFKSMLTAVVILILAWALAIVTQHLDTASFITGLLSDDVSPYAIPTITFLLAGVIAFSTGSSWSTMAILYPIMLPTSWIICKQNGMEDLEIMNIFYNTVSCVLAGSVLGDHCSPISDTTILSSLASSCNHMDHVKTQLPYALTVGGISIFFGTLPASYGISSWIIFPLGLILLYLTVTFLGKHVKFSKT